MPAANSVSRQIRELLEKTKTSPYIGEQISQYEHALQCGDLARKAGADDDLVIASLLHDIGHFCLAADTAPKMESWGIVNHERIGADFLRSLGFSERVVELVESHVDAKRYLVATNPSYAKNLSAASIETLKFQGGPMQGEELKKFSKKKLLKDILRLRAWDEQGKELDYDYPDIQIFINLIDRHL